MRQDQIGIQLYTLRTKATDDFPGTLKRVAEMGYPAVEFAGLYGHSAKDIRKRLDDLGLKAPAAHVAHARLVGDPAAVCDELKTLGCDFAVVPWIGEEERSDINVARQFVETLVQVAEAVRAQGLRLAYHNHDFEFKPLPGGDGTTLWDLILHDTDPSLVLLELDCYWSTYGGADTLGMLKATPHRFPLLHFKDMQGEGANRHDAPIGAGTMDLKSIIAATEGTTEWYIVEQDNPQDPLADAETSLKGMQSLVQ